MDGHGWTAWRSAASRTRSIRASGGQWVNMRRENLDATIAAMKAKAKQ